MKHTREVTIGVFKFTSHVISLYLIRDGDLGIENITYVVPAIESPKAGVQSDRPG